MVTEIKIWELEFRTKKEAKRHAKINNLGRVYKNKDGLWQAKKKFKLFSK